MEDQNQLTEQINKLSNYFNKNIINCIFDTQQQTLYTVYSFETPKERASLFRLYLHKRFFLEDCEYLKDKINTGFFNELNPYELLINKIDLPELKPKFEARCLKNLEDPASFRFPYDLVEENLHADKFYLEQGEIKANQEVFLQEQSIKITDPSSNKHNLSLNTYRSGGIEFSYSYAFLEMMFIRHSYDMVDKVTRAVFDLSKGDLSHLQLLNVDLNDPKSKFLNQNNCATYAILRVDLQSCYENGEKKYMYLPLELYLSPLDNKLLSSLSKRYANNYILKDNYIQSLKPPVS